MLPRSLRVLRARKFVVEDALKLVESTVKWRKEKGVRQMADEDPYKFLQFAEDELLLFYPKAYLPTGDAGGRPVYVERGGIVDVEALMMLLEGDMGRMVDYHIWGNERRMVDE
jgi:hypothetical protein